MPRRASTVRRTVQSLVLITPIVAACIQIGPAPEPQQGPRRHGARASITPRVPPSGTPCVEKGQPPHPDDTTAVQRKNEHDPYCCSGNVDSEGLCEGWPGHPCAGDAECHNNAVLESMKTACVGGHCCLGIGSFCDNGSCCDGLECQPRHEGGVWPYSHACVQAAPKQLGEACSKNFDCQSQVCRKNKCFDACIHENKACGADDDVADGRGCCEGQKCGRLDKSTKSWVAVEPGEKGVCPPVLKSGGGCTAAGFQCDPTQPGGPGSVFNNCCGHCGLDHHCH
jgi:hypothetical protein